MFSGYVYRKSYMGQPVYLYKLIRQNILCNEILNNEGIKKLKINSLKRVSKFLEYD